MISTNIVQRPISRQRLGRRLERAYFYDECVKFKEKGRLPREMTRKRGKRMNSQNFGTSSNKTSNYSRLTTIFGHWRLGNGGTPHDTKTIHPYRPRPRPGQVALQILNKKTCPLAESGVNGAPIYMQWDNRHKVNDDR